MTAPSPRRTRRTARIHILAKERRIGIAERRALQKRLTGHESCADMDEDQLQTVVDALAGRRLPDPPHRQDRLPATALASKMRALWISAWHLGVVEHQGDDALCAFVRNVLRIDAAVWSQDALGRAVEAMKQWLARPTADGGGGVEWTDHRRAGGMSVARAAAVTPRADILRAQWRRAFELGLAGGSTPELLTWIERHTGQIVSAPEELHPVLADAAIRKLGGRSRTALGRGRGL